MDESERIAKFLSDVKLAEEIELTMNPEFKGFGHFFKVVYPTVYRSKSKLYFSSDITKGIKVMLLLAWREAMDM